MFTLCLPGTCERKFDGSLLRAAHITANYLAEFYERNKATAGAQETVRDAQFGSLRVAIAREGKIIAASDSETASVIYSAHIIEPAEERQFLV